jgi:cation diffusion facilitator family transporter
MVNKNRTYAVKKVTLIGAVVNCLLGILKVIVGIIGHSHALVTDGIHSFSDLITDALVVIASHYGTDEVDFDHPYGHQRIETIATLFLALLLILVGLALGWDALNSYLGQSRLIEPGFITLFAALFSIGANEGLFHYTRFAGRYYDSSLLIANAWHHRSDAASSLVVLVGLVGELLGFAYFDVLAAGIVSLMIVHMGLKLGLDSINELVDKGVSEQTLKTIKTIIKDSPGVVALHELRTRFMGGAIYVDVHLIVASRISVSEGHQIGQNVMDKLKAASLSIKDVTVHIDPEDDEICAPCSDLPLRSHLENQLKQQWQDCHGTDAIKHLQLHYLSGCVEVDIILAKEAQDIDKKHFQEQTKTLSFIRQLRFYREQ